MDEAVKELTMLMLYLTAWVDNEGYPKGELRSWKGYPYQALNQLMDEEMITGSYKAKSVYLTEEGKKLAQRLAAKYGIEDPWA
ncbi:MAG: DUF6429 family protein [Bacillota bacterium]